MVLISITSVKVKGKQYLYYGMYTERTVNCDNISCIYWTSKDPSYPKRWGTKADDANKESV